MQPAPGKPAPPAEEQLSDDDTSDLLDTLPAGPKALRIIDALTARAAALGLQAQRDFALAAEWQATAEGYRADADVLRTRARLAAATELLSECARTGQAIWPRQARAFLAVQPAAPRGDTPAAPGPHRSRAALVRQARAARARITAELARRSL